MTKLLVVITAAISLMGCSSGGQPTPFNEQQGQSTPAKQNSVWDDPKVKDFIAERNASAIWSFSTKDYYDCYVYGNHDLHALTDPETSTLDFSAAGWDKHCKATQRRMLKDSVCPDGLATPGCRGGLGTYYKLKKRIGGGE
jgi:hypothetical protein